MERDVSKLVAKHDGDTEGLIKFSSELVDNEKCALLSALKSIDYSDLDYRDDSEPPLLNGDGKQKVVDVFVETLSKLEKK